MTGSGDHSRDEGLLRGARLGFGCSALVGGRTRRESLRLLDAAWDAGIRHFDTARVYGSGDAEELLGSFAGGRRSAMTITTKFGIEPLPSNPATAIAKGTVRRLLRRSRPLLALARRLSDFHEIVLLRHRQPVRFALGAADDFVEPPDRIRRIPLPCRSGVVAQQIVCLEAREHLGHSLEFGGLPVDRGGLQEP